jgi:hypothetical protein
MSVIVRANERSEERANERAGVIRAYRRELPGGGFVAIDVQRARPGLWRPRRFAGRVVVERRSGSRATEHPAPVIARAAARSIEEVVQMLLPAASCNETIGAAFLRLSRAAHSKVNGG